MRFKDKDGSVYTSPELMRVSFCRWDCSGCAINQPGSCWYFVHQHPEEAARLMGYEVVEDEKVDPVTDRHRSKEANMDKQKPRICEVLGVEVGERFTVPISKTEWFVANDGWIHYDNGTAGIAVFMECINHPDRIIRQPRAEEKEEPMKQDKPFDDWTAGEIKKLCERGCEGCIFGLPGMSCRFDGAPERWDLTDQPRFTEEEVADARAIVRLFPYSWETIHRDKDGMLWLEDDTQSYSAINRDLFPSLLPGQSVELSEIVGGAEREEAENERG